MAVGYGVCGGFALGTVFAALLTFVRGAASNAPGRRGVGRVGRLGVDDNTGTIGRGGIAGEHRVFSP